MHRHRAGVNHNRRVALRPRGLEQAQRAKQVHPDAQIKISLCRARHHGGQVKDCVERPVIGEERIARCAVGKVAGQPHNLKRRLNRRRFPQIGQHQLRYRRPAQAALCGQGARQFLADEPATACD